ncbi:hypothetical protein MMC11_002276 [Xylographa trunciseda]|nr:hypothetical protein [Xylographa trunciseda]
MYFDMMIPLLILVLQATLSFCGFVHFKLDLTWEIYAPDGNPRQMVLVNGQFPGPQLRLNYGDSVEVVVYNNLPVEATVHFHGIEQMGTPWSDGVPGVSQKPIQPNATFVYKWTATQYGTYWYHGHVQGLISDGLYGAIIIQPSSSEPSPFGMITNNSNGIAAMKRAEANPKAVLISDWDKYTSAEYTSAEQASNLDLFCVDSILVNGKGAINCQPQALLNSLVNPNLGHLLMAANLTVSDKGCTPLNQAAFTEGEFNNTNPARIPAGLQSGCVGTNGSREVIEIDAFDEWVSLNFISAASSKAVIVSVDQHPMWVYAVDGVYIKPQLADTLFLYNGERYSAMVRLNQTPGDYTIRIANNLPDQLISGFATLSYKHGIHTNGSIPYIDYGGNSVSTAVQKLDQTLLVPYNEPPPAPTADATYILNLGRFGANWKWSMNNELAYNLTQDDSAPLLFNPNSAGALNPNNTIRTKNNTWVDIIMQVNVAPENPAQPPHPVHKHSNKAYLIGSGDGIFNYSSVAQAMENIPENFNLETASLRDSFVTPAILFGPAWIAIRYFVQNPGAFFLHCHIQTHLSGGMALTIMDGVDVWPEIPPQYLYGNGLGY